MSEQNWQLFKSQNEIDNFIESSPTTWIGKDFQYCDRTNSTNDLALEAGRSGGAHGSVFVADAQVAGRGRRGRKWESPPGLALLFSILIRPRDLDSQLLGWIPLAAGLGAVNGLKRSAPVELCLKWPNDIVVASAAQPGWRKLGGILCESVIGSGDDTFVVAGLGLNINQRAAQLPDVPKSPPTSLLLETGAALDRVAVFRNVLLEIERNLGFLNNPALLPEIKSEIESSLRLAWRDREICLRSPASESGQLYRGPFSGLDDYGRIILKDSDGERTIADAEVIELR